MKEIIAENKKYVRAVIRKFTGGVNEDIEQEVYLKTWQNLPAYQEQGKFRQWICTLTANLCRDYFRSSGYRAELKQVSEENAVNVAAPERQVEDIIDAKKRQKLILKAIDDLPKIYRQVVVLYEFEDYPLEAIAKRLKIPLGTVKSRMYNARKILNDNLSFLKGENK